MSRPIRRVAIREGLLMHGDHAMPAGKRHWRATASSFQITDYRNTPLLWFEQLGGLPEVVGEMSLTMPKPTYTGKFGQQAVPLANETLLWFEVIKVDNMPMIRTWWARGRNIERTNRVARLEILNVNTWPERMKQLLQLMGWVG